MSMDALTDSLVELVLALKGRVEPFTLGGGLGLYLKQRHRERQDVRTLIPGELWPPARTTEDMDLLLGTEVVASLAQMQVLRSALDELRYVPVVQFMQFQKQTPRGPVKVDLLTGPVVPNSRIDELKINPPRVRPSLPVQLHAYLTPEAVAADEGALTLPVTGRLPDGQTATVEVRLLGPLTAMLMKLHAFRDRLDDPRKDLAEHHALDLYRVVAMLTEEEFDLVRRLIRERSEQEPIREAAAIVRANFADETQIGILRLRTYVRERQPASTTIDTAAFISALHDLLRPCLESA